SIFRDLLVIHGSGGDFVDDFDSFDGVAERRKLTCKLRLIRNNEKELGTCAVGVTRKQGGRHSSLGEWKIAEFRLQTEIESAGPISVPGLGLSLFGIAAVSDCMPNY